MAAANLICLCGDRWILSQRLCETVPERVEVGCCAVSKSLGAGALLRVTVVGGNLFLGGHG